MPKGKKKRTRPARKARPNPKAIAPEIVPSRAAAKLAELERFQAIVERADSLFRAALSAADVRRALLIRSDREGRPVPFALDAKEAERAIDAMHKMWIEQDVEDAPYRRIRMLRIAENFLQNAMATGKATSAVQTLRELLRSAGAFRANDEKVRAELLAFAGPLPSDPTLGVQWAQRVMTFNMLRVASNTTMDPILQAKLLADMGAKVGMTYNKASMENKAEGIRALLGEDEETDADELDSSDGVDWPATSRFGRPGAGGGPLPGDGAAPPAQEDG